MIRRVVARLGEWLLLWAGPGASPAFDIADLSRARRLLADLVLWKSVDQRMPAQVGKHCRYCLQWEREGPVHDADCPWLRIVAYARHA